MPGVNHPLDFASTGQFSPPKTPFAGTHFTDADVSGGVLHGARRGSSPQASDAHRVKLGRGAPSGVHVYRSGHIAHPTIASRKHAVGVSGDKAIGDVDKDPVARQIFSSALTDSYKSQIANGVDPQTARLVAMNEGEHALLAAGYDGMEATKFQPGSVLLWGDQKIDKAQNQNETKNSSSDSSVSV
jgi:hypothetical protein